MKAKKFIVLGLATIMATAMFGCGNSTKDAQKNDGNIESDTKTVESEYVVTLKWITIGRGMPTNYDSWVLKVNEYIEEKIGVNIEMEVIPWGDWDGRRSTVINTNEPYDIIFGTANTYVADVNLGAYTELTELIDSNMSGLKELMPEKYWDGVRVDGKIYGVPTYKDSSLTNYEIWDKELVEKYDIDYKNVTDLQELTPIFEILKDGENDYPVYVKNDGVYSIFDIYDQLGLGIQVLGVKYNDKEGKVIFTLDEPETFEDIETFHEWFKKGIINPDASTISEARVYNMWRIAQGWPAAAETAWGPLMGKDVVVSQVGETILSNDTVRGSINMISANSKYPEKCLQFLDLVNTDTALRDMFYYGEEGENFEYVEKNGKKAVHKLNEDWSMAGYTQATFFTVTSVDTDTIDQWSEVKELNKNAISSVLLGFTLDTSNIENEVANCREIWLRYKSEIMGGVNDPKEVVPALKAELDAAGWEKVVTEAQSQVDAFLNK